MIWPWKSWTMPTITKIAAMIHRMVELTTTPSKTDGCEFPRGQRSEPRRRFQFCVNSSPASDPSERQSSSTLTKAIGPAPYGEPLRSLSAGRPSLL